MRCKVGDKDGGRAKLVPVQMEPLWGFWIVCVSVCVWTVMILVHCHEEAEQVDYLLWSKEKAMSRWIKGF